MAKQQQLSFGNNTSSSSSSSHVSSNVCALDQRNKTSLVADPLKFYSTRYTRVLPKPSKDGTDFKMFTKAVAFNPTSGGKRSVTKSVHDLIAFGNRPVRMEIDVMKQALEIISTNASGMTVEIGKAVHDFILTTPRDVYNCLPELQMRAALLKCPCAQVKDEQGNVVGVRAPCPCCETNEHVTYDKLRARPLDNNEYKSVFVDVRCECRNPECEEVKKAVAKANEKANVTTSSKSSAKACFSFSNVNAKLIHKLYPAVASTKYPFIERSLGAIHTRLRRSFFSLDRESEMHTKLVARYQDFYRDNTLPIYLELVQKYDTNQRRAFPVPSKVAPSPMGIGQMKAFFKDPQWVGNDRKMIVRLNKPFPIYAVDDRCCNF